VVLAGGALVAVGAGVELCVGAVEVLLVAGAAPLAEEEELPLLPEQPSRVRLARAPSRIRGVVRVTDLSLLSAQLFATGLPCARAGALNPIVFS